MMGLMALMFFAVYLLISIWAVRKAAGWAKANNRKPWLWGGIAAFVMYNLVFWDLIPTLIVHKHYCDTQAGFSVYKTPEQWKAENPGQAEGLFEDRSVPNQREGEKGNSVEIYHLNKRFNMVVKVDPINSWLPVYRDSTEVIDAKNNQIMNRTLGFWAGYFDEKSLNNLKMWMALDNCGITRFSAFSLQAHSDFANIGKSISK